MFRKKYYCEWRKRRIAYIVNYYGEKFFEGKRLLEVGCGYGHIGNHFYNLGAEVHCNDVRRQNVDTGKKLFPHLNFKVVDLNKQWPYRKKFDIILHTGVLYHLNCDIEKHLEKVCNSTTHLILETEVIDSLDDEAFIKVKETKIIDQDQSCDGFGFRLSPFYIENILKKNNMKFNICNYSFLNYKNVADYSWEHKNTGKWKEFQRRFWICSSI